MPRSPAYFTAGGAQLITPGTLFKADGEPLMVAGMSENFLSEDFNSGATTGNLGWSAITANSGTVSVTTGDADAPGIIRLSTLSNNASQAAARLGVSCFLLGGGQLTYSWRVRISALSIVGEEYSLRVGLGDSTTAESTDAVYFCYDRVTDGDFWSVKTISNTSPTKTVLDGSGGNVTSAVSANTWFRLGAVINAAASSVGFYINGTLVKTHASNIPSGTGRHLAPLFMALRSSWTATTVTHDADYYWHYQKLTSAR